MRKLIALMSAIVAFMWIGFSATAEVSQET